MAGLLAGAVAGLGGAMQQNAQSSIEEKRRAALEKLRHSNTMAQQDDRQQFTSGENQQSRDFQAEQGQVDREFRAGESAADRAQRLSLAQMQESGANSRANRGLLQQGMDSEGNPVWFNPVTGDRHNAPEGVTLAPDGKMTARESAQLNEMQERRKLVAKRLEDVSLLPEGEAETLQREMETLNMQIGRQLNPGGNSGLDGEIDAAMGGGVTGEQPPAAQQEGIAPPPKPGTPPESFSEAEDQALTAQQVREQERQRRSENREIESRINEIQDMVVEASPSLTGSSALGGVDVMPGADRERRMKAMAAREELQQLYDSGRLNEDQKGRTQRLIKDLVKYLR